MKFFDENYSQEIPTRIKCLRKKTSIWKVASPGHIRRNHKCGSITPGLSQPQKQGLGHRTPQQEAVPKGARIFNN